ncbi:MAG: coproporphyrinogen-III oxidase family protein [Thermoanaerobaculia bacterium]|nr:coproporphyrinogen-III oxidase family protein [Thermoanaerobaculia bacterium]
MTTSTEPEIGSVFVSNYPPYSIWNAEDVSAARSALASPPRPDTPLGLYLHIPFCRKRCKFCYFRVYTDKNFDEIGSYLDALATEVETAARQPALAGRKPRFVYFGGGTPSYVSVKQLEVLVDRVKAVLPWDAAEEVTFECEPGTLTESKVQKIREIGVTRLSLGIENFDDEILRENGRAHLSGEIDRCMPWIRAANFDQLNVDLIAGMVGERWESWRETVRKTIELDPSSVTIYQLELPWNARYSKELQDGTLDVPLADWDQKRAWHQYAIEQLAAAGYEISSAYTMVKPVPGREGASRFVYRDNVWRGCDLLGTGVASFSHLSGVHFQNADGWGEYVARATAGELPLARAHVTTPRERFIREFILQLKLGRVSAGAFVTKFGLDPRVEFAPTLAALAERGFVRVDGDVVGVTPAGLLRVDLLLPEFYDPEFRGARYT